MREWQTIPHVRWYCRHHIIIVPKYRKKVFEKEISDYTKEIFEKMAKEYGFEIDTVEVMEDHVHVFIEVPPRYSPSQVVQILKSITAREVFKRYPELREQLWAGELWNDGYFVRSVGDKVTADIIRRYIEYQTHEEGSIQLNIFDKE